MVGRIPKQGFSHLSMHTAQNHTAASIRKLTGRISRRSVRGEILAGRTFASCVCRNCPESGGKKKKRHAPPQLHSVVSAEFGGSWLKFSLPQYCGRGSMALWSQPFIFGGWEGCFCGTPSSKQSLGRNQVPKLAGCGKGVVGAIRS